MRRFNISLIVAITLAATLPAKAGSFTGGVVLLADYTANAFVYDAVDGLTVVGKYDPGGGVKEGFRLDGDGYASLGDLPGSKTEAKAVAGDASIVVGKSEEGGKHAVYWDENDAIFVLTLDDSEAKGVNFDGSVIVGKSKAPGEDRAVKWVLNGGGTYDETFLADLGGGKSEALGVSDDGRYVVGKGTNAAGDKIALMWDDAGAVTEIGDLVGGKSDGKALDVNFDGTVVVGVSSIAGGKVAFRWDAGTGIESLGTLGSGDSEATGVSADGSTIVGTSGNGAQKEAFIWTRDDGIQSLRTFLINEYGLGADLADWTLESATISSDGQTVIGFGTNNGVTQTFLAQIPEPSTYAMLMIGLIGIGWAGRRRSPRD